MFSGQVPRTFRKCPWNLRPVLRALPHVPRASPLVPRNAAFLPQDCAQCLRTFRRVPHDPQRVPRAVGVVLWAIPQVPRQVRRCPQDLRKCSWHPLKIPRYWAAPPQITQYWGLWLPVLSYLFGGHGAALWLGYRHTVGGLPLQVAPLRHLSGFSPSAQGHSTPMPCAGRPHQENGCPRTVGARRMRLRAHHAAARSAGCACLVRVDGRTAPWRGLQWGGLPGGLGGPVVLPAIAAPHTGAGGGCPLAVGHKDRGGQAARPAPRRALGTTGRMDLAGTRVRGGERPAQ